MYIKEITRPKGA